MFTTLRALQRRLVLIDIENIAGGGIVRAQQVRDAQTLLVENAALDPRTDHIVLACGRTSADIAGFEWAGQRRFLFRAGIDGADLELLEVLESENVADRFTEVLLVSGDAMFVDAVSALAMTGVSVTVASRPEALSRRLQMAATQTIELSFEKPEFQEAA